MLRWVFRVNGCFEEYFTILNCNVHMRLLEIAHYILWDCRFRDVFALNMTPLNDLLLLSPVKQHQAALTSDTQRVFGCCCSLCFCAFLCTIPRAFPQKLFSSVVASIHCLCPQKFLDTEAIKCLMHYFKSSEKNSCIFYLQEPLCLIF